MSLARRKAPGLRETPPVWLPEYAVVEGRPLHWLQWLTLGLLMIRELSGETAMDRARQQPERACVCDGHLVVHTPDAGQSERARERRIYLQVAEKRFKGINRCC